MPRHTKKRGPRDHSITDVNSTHSETPALESSSSGIELHGDEKEEIEWLMNVDSERVSDWIQNLGPGPPGSAKF